jgi:hypothetical protein
MEMGQRGAGHRALGFVAVIGRAAALAALLGLAGCNSVGDIAGLVAGSGAGVATASPVVGVAVGVAVDTAATEAVNYYGERRQQAEQNAIAAVAGDLADGGEAPWRIRHDIPIGDEHGEVRLVRRIASPLADCREIAYSVEDPPSAPAWYTASICKQTARWKWAAAEPAVERWGYLQ